MDSITHIALGAAVGELMLGKKIGKRALIIGALVNSFPDIDFLAALWLAPADNVLAHRGFTHSILFIVLFTFIFYWGALRWDKQKRVSNTRWFLFFLVQLWLHLFVDAFNAYGVGWLIPLDNRRISFHTIFVVDPFYSSILIVAFILLMLIPIQNKHRIRIAALGFLISSMYLGTALVTKYKVSHEVQAALTKQRINYHRYFTTPTPLNTWLWFAVAEIDSGYYIGYRSVFDKTDSIQFTYVERNEYLLQEWQTDHTLRQLKKFSQGYYTVALKADTLIFNDLRFGQTAGWNSPNSPFAFHFYLNYPKDNLLVMQRGRFAHWNKQTVESLVARIKGNQRNEK